MGCGPPRLWASVPTLLYYLGIILAVEIDARRFGVNAVDVPRQNPWCLLLRFGYTMNMTADAREDVTYVAGEADLGKTAGGVYEYEGRADGRTFRLNYRTKNDYGHFTLKRPD